MGIAAENALETQYFIESGSTEIDMRVRDGRLVDRMKTTELKSYEIKFCICLLTIDILEITSNYPTAEERGKLSLCILYHRACLRV